MKGRNARAAGRGVRHVGSMLRRRLGVARPLDSKCASASPQKSAAGTLTIGMPHVSTAGKRRRPGYVSPSTTYVTLWIDADTTGFRQACSPVASQCTIDWVSTSGTHSFTLALDDGAAISGPGNVLADYAQSETLAAGVNSLPTITLNGVAAQDTYFSEVLDAANSSTCGLYGADVNCFIADYEVDDADGNQIMPPGKFRRQRRCCIVAE